MLSLTQAASLLPLILAVMIVAVLHAPRAGAAETEGLMADLKAEKVALKTDDEVAQREERSIAPSPAYTEEELRLMEQGAEKFEFQSDVSRVMNIIINNVYTNRDVFLRELISNASDALDKIRLASLTDPSQLESKKELEVRIRTDPEKGTLTITDTGVGMTKDELVKNLGTIAHSGTKKFAEMLGSKDASSNLIGQFGVGFYSAFLVADRVVVVSKSNNDSDQWVWESNASDFTVTKDPHGNTLGRGTSITLHLKEDADTQTYLKTDKLRDLIIRYSDFISFPIFLWESHVERLTQDGKNPDREEEEEVEADIDEEEDEDITAEDEEEAEPVPTAPTLVWDWERINDKQPIWTRRKDDIEEEEYNNFFKAITREDVPPLTYIHFTAEGGNGAFKAIIFLPEAPPYSQFDSSVRQKGVKLYVRRVFITEDLDTLLPKYLAFLRGVVDSDDLPLNLSRETLQEHKALEAIRNKLVRKTIAMFQQLGDAETEEEKAKYAKFWKSYGTNIKLGIIEDTANRPRLAKLLRYLSSTTGEQTSFDDYVSRMKEGQEEIYFLSGESVETLKTSPFLEKITERGFEVLFAVDPIDEYTLQSLPKYDKYKLVNLAKEGVKLPGDESEDRDFEEELKDLISYFKKTFSSKIARVKISQRLSRSPCTLVAESWGYTAHMEKVMKAQALNTADGPQARTWAGKKVLELNPTHPVIAQLNRMVAEDKTDPKAKELATLLIDTAAIASGYNVDKPADFVGRVHRMISSSLGVEFPEAAPDAGEAPAQSNDETKKAAKKAKKEAEKRKSKDDDDDDDSDDDDHYDDRDEL